jgi:hypothetical protein
MVATIVVISTMMMAVTITQTRVEPLLPGRTDISAPVSALTFANITAGKIQGLIMPAVFLLPKYSFIRIIP